jgi:hypothetical protein
MIKLGLVDNDLTKYMLFYKFILAKVCNLAILDVSASIQFISVLNY